VHPEGNFPPVERQVNMKKDAFWLMPIGVGVALVVMGVALSLVPDHGVPRAEARPPCLLQIEKEGSDTFRIGGDIAYAIKVTNVSEDEEGACNGFEIVDYLPEGLECEDASVVENAGLQFDIDGCEDAQGAYGYFPVAGQVVTFETTDTFNQGDEVVARLIARVQFDFDEDDDDCVTNTACVLRFTDSPVVQTGIDGEENCDEALSCEQHRRRATATPTLMPTATPAPTNTPLPPAPAATAKPLATIAPPPTGSGSNGGGWSPLTLTLAAAGACLLAVSGGVLARRRIR
jgi:uncharacterized repeat protein (TIGR01451 family)